MAEGFDISSSAKSSDVTSFGAVNYGPSINITSTPLTPGDLAYLGVQTPTQPPAPGLLDRFPLWALITVPLVLAVLIFAYFKRR